MLIGGAAVALIVAVSLIVVQSLDGGGSSPDVPERVAIGQGRILGDPNAPLTVIEYADFQCPVCKRAESSIVSALERDYVLDGRVNIEFRMFPFLGQESVNAALAADAAGEQGKFWEYHDALFNAQGRENSGAFEYDKLVAIAQELGLDVPKFEAYMQAPSSVESLQRELDAARAAGVSSTPTFYVGDEKVVGAQPYGVFQQAINQQLSAIGAAQ
jgi:protein-disulfide isomerase